MEKIKISRDSVIKVLEELVRGNIAFGVVFTAGAIISLSKRGITVIMIIQVVLSATVIITHLYVFFHVAKNQVFNRKKLRNLTDISSVALSFFVIIYYVIYGVYITITDFSWLNLCFVIIGLGVGSALYRNGTHINMTLQKLVNFFDKDTIEIE